MECVMSTFYDFDIIINIRSMEDHEIMMKRLNELGYKRHSPGDLVQDNYNFYLKYGEEFCIRLNNGIVCHDRMSYYENHYSHVFIISVEEYFKAFDKNYPYKIYNLNKEMMLAIRKCMEKTK